MVDEHVEMLTELVLELKREVEAVRRYAPDTLSPHIRDLVGKDRAEVQEVLREELGKFLSEDGDGIPPENVEKFESYVNWLKIALTASKKAIEEFKKDLEVRVQKEGEPRKPKRKFKGFKKRRGEW